RLLPGGPLVILDKTHFVYLGLHLQNTGFQLQGAVLAHGHYLRRRFDTGDLHQI
ncbi:MarR family transcriptional regulator, partial [Dysosmobacter welbionis]